MIFSRSECKMTGCQPISKVNNCFIKCIQNLYLASLYPKEFYIREKKNEKKINCELNQATCARWASYYDVLIPCTFIHVWWHLFTYETLVLANIKFYNATSHVVIANQKRDILEAFYKLYNCSFPILNIWSLMHQNWNIAAPDFRKIRLTGRIRFVHIKIIHEHVNWECSWLLCCIVGHSDLCWPFHHVVINSNQGWSYSSLQTSTMWSCKWNELDVFIHK